MLCVGKPAGDLSTVYSPDRIYPAASRDNRMRSCRKMVKKSRMDLLAWKETVAWRRTGDGSKSPWKTGCVTTSFLQL